MYINNLEHLHRGVSNGQNPLHWPAKGSTGDAATPTAWPFTAYLLPLPLPCREENFTPNVDSGEFRVDNAEIRVSGEPGAEVGVPGVGRMPGPATVYYTWHRPSPRWRARWRQRVELLLSTA